MTKANMMEMVSDAIFYTHTPYRMKIANAVIEAGKDKGKVIERGSDTFMLMVEAVSALVTLEEMLCND